MTPPREESTDDDNVSVSVTVKDGETVIAMHGDRDTAVVVRSDAGERIYLPPEDFDRDAPGSSVGSESTPVKSPYEGLRTDSPYQSASTDSPYQGVKPDSPYQGAESDSPYQAAGETTQSEGLTSTADGYRIRHPEPVTDVRILR